MGENGSIDKEKSFGLLEKWQGNNSICGEGCDLDCKNCLFVWAISNGYLLVSVKSE